MKQKDILTLVVSGIVGGMLSFVLSNFMFGAPADRKATVEVVTPIVSDFGELDTRYFNKKSLNPTQIIEIDKNDNQENLFKDE